MRSLWSTEQRSVTFQDVWGSGGVWNAGNVSRSNETVTADTALGLSAVWACVRLLSDMVASLPLDAYEPDGTGRRQVNPTPNLVTNPSTTVTLEEWKFQCLASLLLWGNAYGIVLERDRFQVPSAVEWVHPDQMQVDQASSLSRATYSLNGQPIPPEDVIHMRAFLRPGSIVGVAPLQTQRETMGLGLAAQRFGSQWFGEGAHPSAVLSTDQPVSQEQAKTIKDRFVDTVRGRREPAVLGGGVQYHQIQVAANESQFIETNRQVVDDVARVFGVPAEMIGGGGSGGSVTYANREQSAIDFLTFNLNPWLVRIERALTKQLRGPQFVKFNVDAILRSDLRTRYDAHQIGLNAHFLTIDEVRALEDRAPLNNGEEFPPNRVTGAPE